jgi:FkbM family methyltransferase
MSQPNVKEFLCRTGLFHRLQASAFRDVYWRVTGSGTADRRSREVAFYRTLLQGFERGNLVFDIGANCGWKTDLFLRLGARVVAAEPDSINQEILRKKFLWCRVPNKPVTIVKKAVSDRISTETMWVNESGSALNTLSRKWRDTLTTDGSHLGVTLTFAQKTTVQTTTLDELIKQSGLPFFIKIDVEGYEVQVLRGLQQPVPYLSFEINLPEFRAEGTECVEILDRLDALGRFNFSSEDAPALALANWVGKSEFLRVFAECRAKSIEVFWRSHLSGRIPQPDNGNP